MKYEYHVIHVSQVAARNDYDELAAFLNEKDIEGWEFITSDSGVLFFRRAL